MDEIAEDYGHGYKGVDIVDRLRANAIYYNDSRAEAANEIEHLRIRVAELEKHCHDLEFEVRMWREGRLFFEPPFVVSEEERYGAALKMGWRGFPTPEDAVRAIREEG